MSSEPRPTIPPVALDKSQLNAFKKSEKDKSQRSVDQTIIENFSDSSARLNVNLKEVYKSLTVLADEVLKKLNEILGDKIPGGVYELKPEEHTPELTAERIVNGVVTLIPIFSSQNPDLQGEELLQSFMKTIRSGIDTGYQQASNILGDIGAFELDGIKEGIEKTMSLVEEKLKSFEKEYRKTNSLEMEKNPAQEPTSTVS